MPDGRCRGFLAMTAIGVVMRTFLHALVAVLVLSGAGVATGQATPHEGIDAAYRDFVAGYASLRPDRVASVYSRDAVYVAHGASALVGRQAIEDSFTRFFAGVRERGATLRLRFRIVERRLDDDAAWDLGYYHLQSVRGDTIGSPSVGRFVTGLRREGDGRWRIVSDSFEASDTAAWTAASEGVEP